MFILPRAVKLEPHCPVHQQLQVAYHPPILPLATRSSYRPGRVRTQIAAMKLVVLCGGPGASASMGDTSTPLGKAVRILNNQLQALTAIDERTDALETRLERLSAAPTDGMA